jgi:tetratricopeptide (TPR) repeat protein
MLSDLTVSPIAETIRTLSAERRSGDLQVRSGKVAKTVFIDHGRIVFAASNLKKDRLGEALVAAGRITAEQFEKASALMRGDARRRFGEALVQSGVLDKRELGHSVARQVKRIVQSLFELESGAASFEDRKCPIPLEYMVSLSVHRLLYSGIRLMSSRELVLAGLGDLDRWVTLATVPPFPFGVKKCTPEELDILEHSKRRATLRRLGWAAGGLSFTRLRAAYAFLASGILQETEAAQSQAVLQPIVQMETSTFLLSALQRRPDKSGREVIRQEVNEELARSARLDRETWLRVSRQAPRDELIRALEGKMERYHALLEATGDDEELKTDIELILGRASSMLRLARQSAEPPAPAPAGVASEAKAATPASPAATVAAPAVEPPPAAVEPPAPPVEIPTAVDAVDEPANEDAVAAEPAERAAEPEAERVSEAPAHEPGMMAADAQIEHLLLEGSVKMTVSDYANAVTTYSRLVELAPKVANFRVRLAIAMALWPKTSKHAEREFVEAIRLDPNNADIHYQFGIYYKAMRVRSRAIAEFRTAVSLSPRHKQARGELEALSPKDSALTSLKKLFR